jgi:hypothetical protein
MLDVEAGYGFRGIAGSHASAPPPVNPARLRCSIVLSYRSVNLAANARTSRSTSASFDRNM